MLSLDKRLVRLAIRTDRADTPVDADSGGVPKLWSGSPVKFALAFFNGESLLTDFSRVSAIAVQIKELGADGAPPAPTAPALAEVLTTGFNTALTVEQWNAGAAAHCHVALSGTELDLAAGLYWAVVVAILDEPVTLQAGKVEVTQDGYGSGAATPPPPAPAWTRSEADARYLIKSGLVTGNLVVAGAGGVGADSGIAAGRVVTADADIGADEIVLGAQAGTKRAKTSGLRIAGSGADAGPAEVPRGNAPRLLNGQLAHDALAPVRAAVVAGRRRRLFTPGTTGAAPWADSGYDLARDDTYAGDNEVVPGSDPRLGLKGGVHRSHEGYFNGMYDTSSRDYSVSILLDGIGSSQGVRALYSYGWDGGGTVALYADSTSAHLTIGAEGGFSGVLPAKSRFWLTVECAGRREFTVYRDGIEIISCATDNDATTLLPSCTSASGPPDPLNDGYKVVEHVYFNRRLTAPERKAVYRGEMPPGLVRGFDFSIRSTFESDYVGSFISYSQTWFAVMGTPCLVMTNIAPGGNCLQQGASVIFPCTVTIGGGDAPTVLLLGSGYQDCSDEVTLVAGVNNVRLTATAPVQYIAFRSGTDFTVSDFAPFLPGVVAHFPPDGVAPSGDWVSRVGAAILRAGPGITPLAPRPQTREILVTLPDTTIPGVAAGVFEAEVMLSAAGTEAAKFVAIGADDSCEVRLLGRLPDGMMLKQGARVVTASRVDLGIMNFNGSDEPTGTIPAVLTHHIG